MQSLYIIKWHNFKAFSMEANVVFSPQLSPERNHRRDTKWSRLAWKGHKYLLSEDAPKVALDGSTGKGTAQNIWRFMPH